MKIAVLGTGTVGRAFAEKLITLNHEVMMKHGMYQKN